MTNNINNIILVFSPPNMKLIDQSLKILPSLNITLICFTTNHFKEKSLLCSRLLRAILEVILLLVQK